MLQTRRLFFKTSALTSLSALAACGAITTVTKGSVTTVTVNVAQIDAWSQAAENMTQLILNLPGINIPTPAASAISLAGATITADLANWDKQTNGMTTYTVDTKNPSNIASTLLADCQKVLTQVSNAVGATTNQTAKSYLSALGVIISLFQAQLGVTVAATSTAAPMSEKQALQLLKVRQ